MKGEELILVIDDIRTFRFPATYARSVAEARRLLYAKRWEEVWLDYDMGGGETLRELIMEIEAGTRPDVWSFVIHTANPDGRMAMRQALINAGGYRILEVSAGAYI